MELTFVKACRFILGLTEAGLFPGANYYMVCWPISKGGVLQGTSLRSRDFLQPWRHHRFGP